jgi:hypothetical protein
MIASIHAEPLKTAKAQVAGVGRRDKLKKVVIVIAVLVVLGALGGGFYLVGPPAEERVRRLDSRRQTDLQRLRLAADLLDPQPAFAGHARRAAQGSGHRHLLARP